MSTSWPWHLGASLLLGPKYSSYHLCRLLCQIGWHALISKLGISLLCLQIYFLHQHIFWHTQWDHSSTRLTWLLLISTQITSLLWQKPTSGKNRSKLWRVLWRNTGSSVWNPSAPTGAGKLSGSKICRCHEQELVFGAMYSNPSATESAENIWWLEFIGLHRVGPLSVPCLGRHYGTTWPAA